MADEPAPRVHQLSVEDENVIRFDIREYLEGLPRSTFKDLYTEPATCLGVMRLLPLLARHAVMRFLPLTEPIPRSRLQFWVNSQYVATLANELKRLLRLNVLQIPQSEEEVPQHLRDEAGTSHSKFLVMNETFRQGLFAALKGSGTGHSFGLIAEEADKYDVDSKFLDKYASTAWEAVLHYLVGTSAQTTHTSAVRNLLLMSGLQERNPNYRRYPSDLTEQKYRITSKGFQFLLQGVNVQLWALMLQYVEQAETKMNLKVTDILNFFFQSACLEVGQSYSTKALTSTQRKVLEDLQYFGLFYKPSPESKIYYPTRIATTLMEDAISSNSVDESINGFIVVETNYKVYAYTSSPLQIAILSLFLDLQTRFQNMVVAVLSRDSVRGALVKGITAEQIISYLSVHAHPEMRRKPQNAGEQLLRQKRSRKLKRMMKNDVTIHNDDKNTSPLPPTVIDQIRLWEMERNRLKSHPGYLYANFTAQNTFDELVNYARQYDYLLWKSSVHRVLIVTAEGHPHVKAYRKERNEMRQQKLAEETLNAVFDAEEDVQEEMSPVDVDGDYEPPVAKEEEKEKEEDHVKME